MRFMAMIMADPREFGAGPAPPALEAAIGRHIEKITKAGVLVTTGGLAPPAAAARIAVSGGTLSVVDGPFAQAREGVGGFAILECPSREAAIEHCKAFMQIHVGVLGPSYTGQMEIRQLFGPEE